MTTRTRTSLHHEALNVTMEDGAVVVATGTQGEEVLTCEGGLVVYKNAEAQLRWNKECRLVWHM